MTRRQPDYNEDALARHQRRIDNEEAAERARDALQAELASTIRARLDLFEDVLEGLPPDRQGVLNRLLHKIVDRQELTYTEDDQQAVWVIGRALQRLLWDAIDASALEQCEVVASLHRKECQS